MRPGQRVTIEVDAYGGREFNGKVDSIAAATGSRFSLLPPENATGNFVKVVQRVPVKIVLDDGQDPEHLLRPGMSVDADGLHAIGSRDRMSDAPSTAVNPWIVAIAVMFATFMEVLDTTVVNVSLPHIASSLSATTDEATWALTSYLVANAIILPMTGWLASTFGRKRLLMLVDGRASRSRRSCAALAPNLASLVIFRIIQGATGGALQPLSQAVLLESFKPEERGKAMGFWGLGIVVAPILGPVLGGWLTENYSWRWVFYINLPVGIVVADHDAAATSSIRRTCERESSGHRLLGHGHAGRRHRRAAVRARQGAAGGLVRVDDDHDAGHHLGRRR